MVAALGGNFQVEGASEGYSSKRNAAVVYIAGSRVTATKQCLAT
jgi:hypothetical protein